MLIRRTPGLQSRQRVPLERGCQGKPKSHVITRSRKIFFPHGLPYQRHPYWHTWVFPGSNPGSRKDKNLKHNAVLRVRLRHPSPLGGSLGRRVGYGPVKTKVTEESVASARLESKLQRGPPPTRQVGKRGQPGIRTLLSPFVFLYCISLRRLLDAVPHITAPDLVLYLLM